MKGNIFSPEDKEFMEIVQADLQRYLQKNIFPTRTVLVFPPFNGFRRFLIHKLIEDNFASSEVAAFSIGQDISRRIVICYKGLISEAASKGLPATIPQPVKPNMIDKDKPNRQRQTPTAAVYRPPAARVAESRRSLDGAKPTDTKKTRVRRPDQQVYVPRPKRASYDNDLPRSRSRSNSRLSLDSDQSFDMKKTSSEESRLPKQNENSKNSCDESILTMPPAIEEVNVLKPGKTPSSGSEVSYLLNEGNSSMNHSCDIIESNNATKTENVKSESEEVNAIFGNISSERETVISPKITETKIENEDEMHVESKDNVQSLNVKLDMEKNNTLESTHSSPPPNKITDSREGILHKEGLLPNEAMETISISSDSKISSLDSSSSSSSSNFMSCSDSKSNDSSADSETEKSSKDKSPEKMDIDFCEGKNYVRSKSRSHHKEEKTRKKIQPTTTKISEVLVISDSSSTDDSMKATEPVKNNNSVEKQKSQPASRAQSVKSETLTKQSKSIDPNECDWESLYDDSGECLVPSLMEELTNSVGRVKIASADSDYRPYQSIEERTNDGECVIEIYDFPAEFKTTDLFNVFAAYRNKNFQIKWVDDTHALGIFPSPLMADEVLACTLPFVKTRPLRLGIAESRNKARNLVLPPLPSMERPKTCTALARRLVTGALGLRIPTSSQEREKEKQVLREAREKRRQEAKQREAAWEGTITSSSAI